MKISYKKLWIRLIEKEISGGRTFTEIKPLDEQGRIAELARIMNGEPITPLSLENARELLANTRVLGAAL